MRSTRGVIGDDTGRIGVGRELPGWWFGSFPFAVRAHALNYHTATAGPGYQRTLGRGGSVRSIGRTRCKASVRVQAAARLGLLPGSVPVSRADSLRIWPLWACLALDLSPGLPAPAWLTGWPDQKPVRG